MFSHNDLLTMNSNECTALCKYALIGCPRRRCSFAHEARDLKPRMCPHGSNCRFDRRTPNFRKESRPCGMFHPDEEVSVEAVYERALEFSKPLTKEEVFGKTKLCKFYKTHCPNRSKCGYAHSEEEVQALICPYGSHCIGESCTFPFHGIPADRSKVLEHAKRGVIFAEIPETLSNRIVICPWEEDEEVDFDAPPVYKGISLSEVRVENENAKLAKEEEKANAMDLTPEAEDEYKPKSKAAEATKGQKLMAYVRQCETEAEEKKKLAKIVMENFELFSKHSSWVLTLIQ